jgi:dTDP-4-dehydrorhamnose 3,5-epimerase
MHFQVENSVQQKLIIRSAEKSLDAIVDAKPKVPYLNKRTFVGLGRKVLLAILDGKAYVHGFISFVDNSLMEYFNLTDHFPAHDKSVLWSSIDFHWPIDSSKISSRDSKHPAIGGKICIFS